jgi:hypothetical protein
MNSIRFLHWALIATAVIHGGYLGHLFRRYSQLCQQLTDLHKEEK